MQSGLMLAALGAVVMLLRNKPSHAAPSAAFVVIPFTAAAAWYVILFVVLVVVPTVVFAMRPPAQLRDSPLPVVGPLLLLFLLAATPICWGIVRALVEYTKPVEHRCAGMGLFAQLVIWLMFLVSFLPGIAIISLIAAVLCLGIFAIDTFVALFYFFGISKTDTVIPSGYQKPD